MSTTKDRIDVLLVEDDEEDYLLTKDLLSRLDGVRHEIHWVNDYRGARKAADEGDYDVYLVDYRLGAEDGIELVRELVANGHDVPVIVLTGQGNREVDVEAALAGAADYLVKGECSAILLERTIRYAMRSHGDMRALRESEETLRQAQKMEAIGQLAGGVAHDFNNMLAAITGFAELLLVPTTEIGVRERGQIEQIKTAGERAAALTGQLLAFSRRQVLQPRVLDLNEIVSETETMLRRLIGEDIEFVTSLAPDLACVQADATQIGQVLMNLAVNARDAMPEGGRLEIETASVELDEPYPSRQVTVPPGAYVMVTVSDTGTGMDAETCERLFEPFFTTKEEGKGTGLGLSTVYGIVKQSGGYIWADSEPGQGSSFTVYLPQVEAPAGAASVVDADAPAAASGPWTVLLVEDEDVARAAIGEMLLATGHSVLAARDGEEALAHASEHGDRIDIVMTDVVMPKMSGTELAEALRKRWPALPILYTSGYIVDGFVRRGILAEASFIPKPFSLEALQRKLCEVIRPASVASAS